MAVANLKIRSDSYVRGGQKKIIPIAYDFYNESMQSAAGTKGN